MRLACKCWGDLKKPEVLRRMILTLVVALLVLVLLPKTMKPRQRQRQKVELLDADDKPLPSAVRLSPAWGAAVVETVVISSCGGQLSGRQLWEAVWGGIFLFFAVEERRSTGRYRYT